MKGVRVANMQIDEPLRKDNCRQSLSVQDTQNCSIKQESMQLVAISIYSI